MKAYNPTHFCSKLKSFVVLSVRSFTYRKESEGVPARSSQGAWGIRQPLPMLLVVATVIALVSQSAFAGCVTRQYWANYVTSAEVVDIDRDCASTIPSGPGYSYDLKPEPNYPRIMDCWRHNPSSPSNITRKYRWVEVTNCCGSGYEYKFDGQCTVGGSPRKAVPGEQCAGNPISPAISNKSHQETDYRHATSPHLFMQRHYNSYATRSGYSFGRYWRHDYDRLLRVMPHAYKDDGYYSQVTAVRGNGQEFLFEAISDSNEGAFTLPISGWSADPDVTYQLEFDGTLFILTDQDGNKEIYNRKGRLNRIEFREGSTLDFAYASGKLASVQDEFGNTLTFQYNADGQLSSIADPDGELYQYTFNTAGNIATVTYPDAAQKEYFYEDPNFNYLLTGIKDENSGRFATYRYNSFGRPIESFHGDGAGRVTIAYVNQPGYNVRVVTDALGNEITYAYTQIFGVPRVASATQPCSSCSGGNARRIGYDANGFKNEEEDFNGNTTRYVNDARGRVTSRTDAYGTPEERTVTTTWHPDYRLPLTITEPGRITNYTYDANGNRLSETVTDTATSESRTTTWTYNAYGQVLTVDGPRTDVSDATTYTYDTQGNLATVTNALGHLTQYTQYDAHGNPLEIIDANGVVTRLSYDLRQRLKSRTVAYGTADAATTTFDYDLAGQLVKTTLPNGAWIAYEYDAAHRLTAIEDNLSNRIDYVLDALGNRIEETVSSPDGSGRAVFRQTFRDYNQLNRLVAEYGPAGTRADFGYDNEGNRTTVTDAEQNVTTSHYDALNRLFETVDALSGVTTYDYDTRDNLTQVVDPRGVTTNYLYNGFNELTETQSPDAGTTTYSYDKAGNRISQTDARGITVNYQYDALSRLTFIDYPGAAQDITYTYDGGTTGCTHCTGRLTRIDDETGYTEYAYDARGNLTSKLSVVTTSGGDQYLPINYDFDTSDNLIGMTYPSGDFIQYQRDAAGRSTGLTLTRANGSQVNLVTQIQYAPFGPVTGKQFGNGIAETRTFDQEGRITGIQSNLLDYSYTWNTLGNIIAIIDNLDAARTQSFDYDALYRLTDASGVYGAFEWSYDAVGNRLSQTETPTGGTAATTTYTYAATSNRLATVTGSNGTVTYQYDATGNTLDDGKKMFSYDNRNRFVEAEDPATQQVVGSYGHNTLGQRVVKTTTNGTVLFAYDEAGHLIGEYDASGNRIREYIWLGDTPVVMLENANVYYLHADHLNTPKVASNQSRQTVWKGDYQPFGEAAETVSTIDMPLRFSGQYEDQETGLNYNYFRSYDAAAGRYTQHDPIGLDAGLNSYMYVLARPVVFSDRYGLAIDQTNSNPIKPPAPGSPGPNTCLLPGERCDERYQRGLTECMKKRGLNHPSVQSCRYEWQAWFEDCAMNGGKRCFGQNSCGPTTI